MRGLKPGVYARDGPPPDDGPGDPPEDPGGDYAYPWLPEFERELRDYERRRGASGLRNGN